MKNILTTLTKPIQITAFCFSLCFFALDASAFTLEEIKAAGLVGERNDGLLAIVDKNAKGKDITEIKAFIDDINLKRLQKYKGLSKQNSIKIQQIQLLTGEKVMQKAPAGTYIMIEGKWKKKQ
ncbi:MAG: YdbL family protein [Alphaproteobacteria bacterium]|nr:YdbL family protein [Alphaproteobacteria bacterium]